MNIIFRSQNKEAPMYYIRSLGCGGKVLVQIFPEIGVLKFFKFNLILVWYVRF